MRISELKGVQLKGTQLVRRLELRRRYLFWMCHLYPCF